MSKYTTILFDTDNTLLDFTKAEAYALRDALSAHSLEYSEHARATYSAVNDSFWKRYERGEIEKKEIFVGRFRVALEQLGFSAPAKSVASLYEKRLGSYHFAIEGALEMCERLGRKYDINIVTNGRTDIQTSRLNDSGLIRLVNKVFISEQIGFPKPEKGFFDAVKLSIPEKDISKILIVGDSLSSDILGGINAGIDTCWYNPHFKTTDIKPTYEINKITDLEKLLEAN